MRCFDSDSIKSLGYLPRSAVIVGGGIIAVEFARIFAALGARVTMVVRSVARAGQLNRRSTRNAPPPPGDPPSPPAVLPF